MCKLYRKNVGVVVCKEKKVLLCARSDHEDLHWQFPQGGVEEGEDIIEAARRELWEETGIKNVKFVSKIPFLLRYDFPMGDKKHCYYPYVGQEQSWLLFEFFGSDRDINFEVDPKCVEFKKFEWVDISEAPKRIVAFKKDVYTQVANYFAPIIRSLKNE